jgi:protoporphyrinogen oxidase
LHGLPDELVVRIIRDFAAAAHTESGPIDNYEQWLRASFGDTFADTFPMQYAKKYHTTDAANLSTDWIGPRVYQPSIEEVVRGALSPSAPNVHYVTHFRYPNRGGFVSYLDAFLDQADVKLDHRLVGLRPTARELRFANGVVVGYDEVISSIPLPELIPLIEGVPADVREAASRLACSECVVVSIGVNRPNPHDADWTYFYDDDIFFTRISTPHRQSRNNVPDGCACLMAECYFSDKYRPLDRSPIECIQPVVRDLRRVGIVADDREVIFSNAMRLKYANVIFDLDRASALEIVHGFLDDVGVQYCGRYGLWAYIWTDQAFLSGEKAAERALRNARRLV